MKKGLLFLVILLAIDIGLVVTTRPVTADGANHVYFTVREKNLCDTGVLPPGDPNCTMGTPRSLPNGKTFLYGFKTVVQFTATDPRWTALCYFSGDPFLAGSSNATPVTGSWVCTPNDPAHPEYANGWWEGRTSNIFVDGKMVYTWTGKGYGVLDNLLVIHRNTINNSSNEVEIIELPGYQP